MDSINDDFEPQSRHKDFDDTDIEASAPSARIANDEEITTDISPLTPKEKAVLGFLETYARINGYAPTYQEICSHFQFASFNSAQRYLKQLESKGYLRLGGGNQKRAIRLLRASSAYQDSVEERERGTHVETVNSQTSAGAKIPLLGRVAAGAPIEAHEFDEFIDVPASLVKRPERTYALRVRGQSMIEDGILDGDVILVERQSRANNGEIVVAVVSNTTGQEEATVKRFYAPANRRSDLALASRNRTQPNKNLVEDPHQNQVELRPANSSMQSLWYDPKDVQIRGTVVGLIRKFW